MANCESKIKKLFNKGCTDHHLLSDGDRILIALSGGKDSLMLARLLALRSRIYSPRISVEAAHVIMDNIPYETDRSYLQAFCDELGIKLHILHSRFDESTDPRKTRCFLCAWNRRKTLFNFAVENGFNKIALGHHNDDIIVTYLMNITFEGSAHTMPPILQLEHYPLQIIRPLCLVHEDDIREMSEKLGFQKQKALCPYEEVTNRKAMTDVFHHLQSLNPEARYSLSRVALGKQ
ncbi:MAG: tRNA 2-thiocytidine biosynthesis TtcA family protein [Prevotellaceae bacterium]|nr:tRNA 2-thiocytidine biosynthesis TtcA family protein [Prevotellaceae bacterium]